jgi:hypothetical protein
MVGYCSVEGIGARADSAMAGLGDMNEGSKQSKPIDNTRIDSFDFIGHLPK